MVRLDVCVVTRAYDALLVDGIHLASFCVRDDVPI